MPLSLKGILRRRKRSRTGAARHSSSPLPPRSVELATGYGPSTHRGRSELIRTDVAGAVAREAALVLRAAREETGAHDRDARVDGGAPGE